MSYVDTPHTGFVTRVIKGADVVEDALLDNEGSDANRNSNFGNYNGLFAGTLLGNYERSVIRFATGALPDGSILAVRLCLWQNPFAASTQDSIITIRRIKAANDWAVGTATGASQAGSCCWNYAKYNTQGWAGSVGCGTEGTDYDTDASPPSLALAAFTSGSNTVRTITLPVAWVTGWRSGGNNGIMLKEASEDTSGKFLFFLSTEVTGFGPYLEIDYTTSVQPNLIYWKCPF